MIILFAPLMAVSATNPVINLDGHSNIQSAASLQTAGFRVSTNGYIHSYDGSTYTPVDTGTDWIIPRYKADSTYECRVTNVTGSAWTSAAAANDTWIALTSDRLWYVQDSDSGPAGIKQTNFDIQIRKSGGPVLATGSYYVEADYDIS
jgi:hypothetical protein